MSTTTDTRTDSPTVSLVKPITEHVLYWAAMGWRLADRDRDDRMDRRFRLTFGQTIDYRHPQR